MIENFIGGLIGFVGSFITITISEYLLGVFLTAIVIVMLDSMGFSSTKLKLPEDVLLVLLVALLWQVVLVALVMFAFPILIMAGSVRGLMWGANKLMVCPKKEKPTEPLFNTQIELDEIESWVNEQPSFHEISQKVSAD